MADYHEGQTIRLSANIQVAGVDADPATLTFRIRADGTGDVTTYEFGTDAELVKDSTGDYHVDWLITESGKHFYRFQCESGAASGAGERSFNVVRSRFT